ncbi:iron ABC transporter permease [Limosilactobacillus sp. STM2_1]|uniref:Iron ABC transporter permease n=1 Tax=Limosilactobacillus rudii TaxID=2759755 RepID=A0A7W3YP63_9LACO|nr:iron ABC transporter permease [Limosilactobacillus rudii]MBB1078903.1 iron ABC transporter permease [Limosilactobacillus rudii]MBB1098221.1 iron ABC transporter permease [Limosilactobacillus rudii]MCD7135664.1 iron ABC transporter permease [Limosilactobacillus rudii]
MLIIVAFFIALSCGRIYIPPTEIVHALFSPHSNPATANIIYNIRLPRIIAAVLIGAGLAMSGCAFQSVFHNLLVSPDILGVSYGAAVGAASAILLGLGIWFTQLFAFICGIIAVSATLLIARIIHQRGTLIIVLAGIVVSGFMQALIGLLKYIADPDSQLQSIVYWQLGSLAKVDISSIIAVFPMLAIGAVILIFFRWHLTILSLGDQNAQTIGINVAFERLLIIGASTLLTAATVCLSGNIGWVGLVIPHISRLLVGDNTRRTLPIAGLVGALFLLIVDTLARSLSAGEIPLSILTGFIGAPLFIYILIKKKVRLN